MVNCSYCRTPAPEIFHFIVEHDVLRGLQGVRNTQDDILVYGINDDHHNENLMELIKRLEELGLTVHDPDSVC
ncbi:unnamed protein product [Didymodactylos carnosus]|uniref:Uncharacterized protein n=1 Tax=Didymodactylos carnosus TaxID=1234261 RepID=A0A814X6J7_9BILA|nr:unnamed protein product [Didymodactylos carnosus]CAF1210832.1 unnamed protein product [Didymodactylos carnosus]CAF3665105.1 unnamed protein product [Didymodactylos carnosus]CAF3974780.1 unnamed protein product [Didymodactylos carnosus]